MLITTHTMATVKLRKKRLAAGKQQSLYLDFWPPIPHPDRKGKTTRREFLGLYLHNNPKTTLQRKHNKSTFALAENIRAQRQLEVQGGHYGFLTKDQDNRIDFLAYFAAQAKKRISAQSNSNYQNWRATYQHLQTFTQGHCKLEEVDKQFCEAFKSFLYHLPPSRHTRATKLAPNTVSCYFTAFKTALKAAYEEELIPSNPGSRVRGVGKAEVQREFLTLEELQGLHATECELPRLKEAALFSALTGLRFSDIHKLCWSEVRHSEALGYHLRFSQQKTQAVETLPIAKQAYELLGSPGLPTTKVFQELPSRITTWHSKKLKAWIMRAGISKSITFHCFRHTFATLQLTLGTDIYTVSKLLGHKALSTTQLYAQIVNQKKTAAVDRLAEAWSEVVC